MPSAVRELEPAALWNHFADLNAVPRASKKEEAVIEFMRDFGSGLGLTTLVDPVGNVIIRKPATPGREHRTPVVMQSHLDMVHQKNSDCDFDFETQGIAMLVEGDWVKARGTTLGADNGIGVATIMTLLSSSQIPHPPLEALFTIDEETGMTGAKGLQGGLLQGRILLNLDTENDRELTIGCAGGVDVTARAGYSGEAPAGGMVGRAITVSGLQGGHSGMDIHLGRGNANKLMNRLLWRAAQEVDLRIAEIDGGGLRNAIPRESRSLVAVPAEEAATLDSLWDSVGQEILAEYRLTDPQAKVAVEAAERPAAVLPRSLQRTLLAALYACPSGIHRMSPSIDDLVQTSNNLARVLVREGEVLVQCLTRSSVNTERDDLANAICAVLSLLGGEVEQTGAYTGWEPAPQSEIVQLMSQLHEELFQEPPQVLACHAGLECGILGQNYPGMDMISFGPNILGAHSPDERVQISSVQKFWKFVQETLKRIP